MRLPTGRRLVALLTVATLLYAAVAWWLLQRFSPEPIGLVGMMLVALAVAAQFGGKWVFGELFREGVELSGGELDRRSAFRAALVGAGVSRLIPVGGAITPVAMAWTVRRRVAGTAGAAVRATTLNYAGLLIGTGLALVWVRARNLVPIAQSGLVLAGLLSVAAGLLLMLGSGRLATLSRLLPRRLRLRVEGVLLDHTPGLRTQALLWWRLALEAAALVFVLRAFGIDATPTQMIAAFGASQLFGGLPGTPGGLGLAEAGLIGALSIFGFPPEETIAATIVYRVVSYWLPAAASLLAGGLSFVSHPPEALAEVAG